MADMYYNDAGTWRKLQQVHYNDGGTWRKAKELWYNDAGTWRKVFSAGFSAFALFNKSLFGAAFSEPGIAEPGLISINFLPTGQHTTSVSVEGEAITTVHANEFATPLDASGAAGALYEARATYVSGSASLQGPIGSWQSLSVNRSWSLSGNVVNGPNVTATYLFEVREVASGVVKCSANITMTAESTYVP
jgi:hypothetical protein